MIKTKIKNKIENKIENKMEKATFGAGCFWGVEDNFMKLKGVLTTTVGYMGGTLKNPTYHDVSSGKTGHVEVVQVEYDPAKITYEKLLEVFWKIHYPLQINRQGPDVGTQYRSVIFYHNVMQKKIAEKSKKEESLKRDIATKIEPAKIFYKAEEYHQKYLQKTGLVC